MNQLVTLTKHDNVGVLALNNPPVNALSHALRVELRELFASALADTALAAVVIYCEGRTFIAGADIREFGKPPRDPDLPEIVEFVGGAAKPVIAAIHGTALGGGLELALACDFRIAAAGAKLGLPEVTLGILPGAGGTQRLPRLIGARAALDMIVGGGILPATKARALGLIDEIVEGELKANALAFAAKVLAEQRPLRKLSEQSVTLDEPDLFDDYERTLARKSRGVLAPFHAIKAIRAAVELPFGEGLARERELFRELMASPQSKALRHVFFAERETGKPPGQPEGVAPREVKSVGVIGDGALGGRIAACFANARIPVTLLGTTQEHLDRGAAAVQAAYASALEAGTLPQAQVEERLARIRPTLSFADLSGVDLVVEAVFEDLDLKREVFAALDAACKRGVVLATHTSHLDIDEIAAATTRAEEVVGLHFFTPADTVRGLEVVRSRSTLPDVCATAMQVGKALGKVPVLVRAQGGLVSSRMLEHCWREASMLVEEGALPEQVDRVLRDFGFEAGPFAALETAGGLSVDWLHFRSKTERRGFRRRSIDDREILERCLYAIINEGARIIEAALVPRPLEIDMIWVHGLGFPPHRGGPLFHADHIGLPTVYEAVLHYRERVGTESWHPAPLLEKLAKEQRGFYD